MHDKIDDLVDATLSIEAAPEVVGQVQELCARPDVPIPELVALIETDPGLAVQLLKVANSPLYRGTREVSSVLVACILLGVRAVRELVVQAVCINRFSNQTPVRGFSPKLAWGHAFRTAILSRTLHEYCKRRVACDATEAYTCGLLRNIGRFVLLQQRRDEFAAAVKLSREGAPTLDQAERWVFGFSATAISHVLAQRWGLGMPLVMATSEASREEDASAWATAALVRGASAIANGLAGTPPWREALPDLEELAALDIGAEEVEAVQAVVRRAAARSA